MATVSEIQGVLRLRGGAQFSRQIQSRMGDVEKAFNKVKTAVAGAGIVLFFKQLNQAANEAASAKLGLESIASFKRIDGIEDMIKDLKVVKSGLVDYKDAAQSVQNLLRRGFNLEQTRVLMNRLGEAASFSRQQHLSFGEALKSATQGLKNENSILLDNAGITKNLAQMWKEYAGSIGKGAMSLSVAEKVQAEYNGILKETEAQLGDLDKLVNSQVGQQARLTAQYERFKVVAGSVLNTVLAPIFKVATALLEAFNNLSPSLQRFTMAVGGAGTALWFLRSAIQWLLPALGPVGWVALGVSAVISLFTGLEAITKANIDRTKAYRDELQQFRQETQKLTQAQLQAQKVRLTTDLQFLESLQRRMNDIREQAKRTGYISEPDRQFLLINKGVDERLKAVREKLAEVNKLSSQQVETVKTMTDKEKDLLDEQLQNQYEHGVVSRDVWLNYLRNRLNDFKQWSDEWTDIHDQILALEKEKNAERLGEEAKLQQQTLEMRGQFIEQYQQTMERANTAVLDNLRDNMNQMQALVQEKVFFITDAFGRMGDALVQSFSAAKMNPAKMQLKGFFKEILIGTIEFLQRFLIAAKIKTIAESAINWTAALKSAAPLIAANALLEGLKGQVAAMANGSYVTAPTLALVGEAGQPEIVAPERDFMSYSNMLIDRVLNQRPNNTVNHGGVTMVNNFNTPLQDRRMARLLAEQNSQQVKREMKRSKRYLNQ